MFFLINIFKLVYSKHEEIKILFEKKNYFLYNLLYCIIILYYIILYCIKPLNQIKQMKTSPNLGHFRILFQSAIHLI